MKKFTLILFISGITWLSAGQGVLIQKAYAADIAQTLCEYVAVDDKNRMRKFLKSNKLKIRNIFNSIQCNGKNMLEFAAEHNANETGELMIKKLPKSDVTELMGALPAGPLLDAAKERVQ